MTEELFSPFLFSFGRLRVRLKRVHLFFLKGCQDIFCTLLVHNETNHQRVSTTFTSATVRHAGHADFDEVFLHDVVFADVGIECVVQKTGRFGSTTRLGLSSLCIEKIPKDGHEFSVVSEILTDSTGAAQMALPGPVLARPSAAHGSPKQHGFSSLFSSLSKSTPVEPHAPTTPGIGADKNISHSLHASSGFDLERENVGIVELSLAFEEEPLLGVEKARLNFQTDTLPRNVNSQYKVFSSKGTLRKVQRPMQVDQAHAAVMALDMAMSQACSWEHMVSESAGLSGAQMSPVVLSWTDPTGQPHMQCVVSMAYTFGRDRSGAQTSSGHNTLSPLQRSTASSQVDDSRSLTSSATYSAGEQALSRITRSEASDDACMFEPCATTRSILEQSTVSPFTSDELCYNLESLALDRLPGHPGSGDKFESFSTLKRASMSALPGAYQSCPDISGTFPNRSGLCSSDGMRAVLPPLPPPRKPTRANPTTTVLRRNRVEISRTVAGRRPSATARLKSQPVLARKRSVGGDMLKRAPAAAADAAAQNPRDGRERSQTLPFPCPQPRKQQVVYRAPRKESETFQSNFRIGTSTTGSG